MISLHSFLGIFSIAYVQHSSAAFHGRSPHHLVFLVVIGLGRVDCQAQLVHFQADKVLVKNICPIEQNNYLVILIHGHVV